MNKKDLLQQYFEAAYNAPSARRFFLGFYDYINFIDRDAELDAITEETKSIAQERAEDLQALYDKAVVAIDTKRAEVEAYIKKNNASSETIEKAWDEYDRWKNREIIGSAPLPESLNEKLFEVLRSLFRAKEHRAFAEPYFVIWEDNPDHIKSVVPVPELSEYRYARQQLEYDKSINVWGFFNDINLTYQVIKRGEGLYRELLRKSMTKNIRNTWTSYSF